MKRIFAMLLLSQLVLGIFAIPAKKGIWQTLPLDGRMVRAQLMGDEHLHYWLSEDGRCLTEQDGCYVVADMEQLKTSAMNRRMKASTRRQLQGRRKALGDFTYYTGQKKGLIILVEFTDMQFLPEDDSLRYTRICNELGYDEGYFQGSVHDYFRDQSYGKFDLTFDIVGPVQMPNNYKYYGQDFGNRGDDARPGEMVATACEAVDSLVNFQDYDWDDDGIVDQVMCIYAGMGQADGGNANTIWPHEWELVESDYGNTLTLDDVVINTYAVTNERSYSGIEGIGTLCHEFSHCLGLPDFYDIFDKGNFGMGYWSLMDLGSYNGDGFCPAGYTSFERFSCGWADPVVLDADCKIDGMKSLADTSEVYMVRNDAYENEYFLLENRQQVGWDSRLPGSGLLILYVDYDHEIWAGNVVNSYSSGIGGYPKCTYQHCTIFHAGNRTYGHGSSSDPYPYQNNDSLTNTSSPAAALNHENSSGKKLMDKGILNITRNSDGTVSFRFRNDPIDIIRPDGFVFHETFDKCNGQGGNDDIWNNSIASSLFVPDLEGWDVVKGYGGWQCARFGNGSTAGKATTPEFELCTGEGLLSFKASGWDDDGNTLALSVEGDGIVKPASVTLESFTWNEYVVRIIGDGPLRVTFSPEKRFLLDEVSLNWVQVDSVDAVSPTYYNRPSDLHRYYTLDGRYVGSNLNELPRGIYIVGYSVEGRRGKKIVR